MKTLILALALLAPPAARADVIAQWNFNSAPPDASVSTGSTNASVGSGILRGAGGVSYAFAAGHTIDTAAADNSALNLSAFPAAGAANKSAGLQVAANTAGYRNISISWSHRCSATGSRYYRLLYSTDGFTFLEATNVFRVAYASSASSDIYFTNFLADLSGLSGVDDNPNFAIQILSEFESTAIKSGSASYVAASTGSSYGASGTVRFEMFTISGSPFGIPNTAPSISPITNITMRANTSYPAIPITIGDAETAAGQLVLRKYSSNPALLPETGIALQGSGANQTVVITPAHNQTGSANVSLAVVDEGGKSNATLFAVVVIPTNTLPVISPILNPGTVVDTPSAPIAFTVGDLDTPSSNLLVTAASGNTILLPNSRIQFGGGGSNRTVTLAPAPGKTGHAPVTISVSDGVLSTNRSFVLSIDPSAGTLFQDSFSYAAGSLLTNSSFLWQNHSGTAGELGVVDGTLYVSSASSEDVNARLRGEPYTVASNAVLYYCLTVSAYNIPTVLGDYFAHLKDNGSNFRAKLFVSSTNAELGYYRIGIANGASIPTNGWAQFPADITFDETNLVVARYQVAAGRTTLWLNPLDEASPSVTASDVIGSTNSITQFAIRESRFQGDLFVDNVRVATSFDEALGRIPANARLRVSRAGPDIQLAWPASANGYSLQFRPALGAGSWQAAPQIPAVVGSEKVVAISSASGSAFYRLIKP